MRNLLVGLSAAAVLVAPRVASAQVAPPEKGFIRPLVGATVGAGPGVLFGATFGVKAGPKLQITGEMGRMTNILPTSVSDEVARIAAFLAPPSAAATTSASARATYGLVGFRHPARQIGEVQTFVEFGVGAANVSSELKAELRGSELLQSDITSQVRTPFTTSTPTTKPMVSIGASISLGVGRMTAVEVGYRYARVFTKTPAIDISKIVFGFRYGF